MDEQPDAQVRRKLLRDLLGYAVGSFLRMADQPFSLFSGGVEGEPSTEDSDRKESIRLFQTRLAEKTGLSLHKIDESHLGELLSDLRAALDRGEASIRIPREMFIGFVATYAGSRIYREKHVYLSDLQFSKEVDGRTFDIVAHASFGRLCVQLRESPVSESEVSDFLKLCEASNWEESWLIAPGLETKLVRGEPIRLWENRYVIPVVRLLNYEAIFDGLLSPVITSLRSSVVMENQAVVLRLSREKVRENP